MKIRIRMSDGTEFELIQQERQWTGSATVEQVRQCVDGAVKLWNAQHVAREFPQ